jgi:hypothetical protein
LDDSSKESKAKLTFQQLSMKNQTYPPVIDDFWTQDVKLFDGVFYYYHDKPRPVRGKIHTSEEPYRLEPYEQDIRPVATLRGTRTYVMMHPYVFEPILTLTVGLYKKPKQYADMGEAIGETVGGPKQEGVRDVQIGSAQAWYYHEDKIIELWECFLDSRFRSHPLVNDPHMHTLWQGFEQWLVKQFPQATRIISPFNDPIAETLQEYQAFLRSQGFEPVAKAAFGKRL